MRTWRKPTASPSASIKGLTRNYAEKTLFLTPNPMQRSLLLIALAALFVGCKTSKSTASAGVASSGDVRFSWEKDAPAPAADPARISVRNVRADLSLLELGALEKRDPGTKLQLTKGGKNFLVEVIKGDDVSTIVAISPNQASVPEVRAGDDLAFAVLAQ